MKTDQKKIEEHPLSHLIPEMTEDEYDELKKDIQTNGLRNPIVLYEGKILDGRHRYRACLETHTGPKFETYTGNDPFSFVLSLNIQRRHLTASQKAAIAVDLLPYFEKLAKERMYAGKKHPTQKIGEGRHHGEAIEQSAKVTGANRQYVADIGKIKEKSFEIFQKIKRGEISISEAKETLECLPIREPELTDPKQIEMAAVSSPEKVKRTYEVALELIQLDPEHPRTIINEEYVKWIATTIKIHGIINPIEIDETGMIITGGMRYRAAIQGGLKSIPAKIFKIDPYNRLKRQLSENIHKSGYSSFDQGEMYTRLMGWSENDQVDNISGRIKISALHKKLLVPIEIIKEKIEFYLSAKDEGFTADDVNKDEERLEL